MSDSNDIANVKKLLASMSDSDKLSFIAEQTFAAKLAAVRSAPDDLLWTFWPGDGGFEPVAAGESILDIRSRTFKTPSGNKEFRVDQKILDSSQSAAIVVDGFVFFRWPPGVGFFLTGGAILEAPAKHTEQVIAISDAPYNLLLVFGTGLDAPRIRALQLWMQRYSDTTILKTNVAGVADAYSPLLFVPVSQATDGRVKSLNQTNFGKNFIFVPGWGLKTFIVRNLGSVAADVQIYGSGTKQVADQAGYIPDSATATVSPGAAAVLETGRQYGVVQLNARVNAVEAAATGTRLIVEYNAIAPSLR